MQWKKDLIARVDARVHGDPVQLPEAVLNDALRVSESEDQAKDLEYTRVKVTGRYQAEGTNLVRTATARGTGYWTLTPLRMVDGRTVWINRGFVPAGTKRDQAEQSTPISDVEIIGLLRPSELGGSLLQENSPQEDRWYSRDLKAMAAARKIGAVLPMFVDAQEERVLGDGANQNTPELKPVAGLTVINFPDNHLMYMLTWFTLAILSAGALVFIWRRA